MIDDFNAIVAQSSGSVTISDASNLTTTTSSVAIIGGSTYTHNQLSSSSTWTITHNLSRFPSVTIVDSAGTVQIGEVFYVSSNQVIVSFSSPFGGKAYLN
jgi:hypothetical protein